MPGKNGGHKRATPYTVDPARTASHAGKDEKEQNCVSRVKDDVCDMMATGVCPPKLDVEHVGQPRNRVPVAGVKTDECRCYVAMRKSSEHARIIRNVIIIIIV